MLIRLGYDIQFETSAEVPIVTLLNVHPSRKNDLREPDELQHRPAGEHRELSGHVRQSCLPPGGSSRQNSIAEFHAD